MGVSVTTPPAATPALPPELAALGSLPDVLLPYQKELLRATAANQVVVCEKSRRIGATWGVAADAVLAAGADRAAGGMDVFYIGYNLDMTREFVDTCAMWARAFHRAAADVKEFIFRERDAKGADREIQAFRINFASGFEIVALCSRPRSLRGRQGYVIIDEAAFHDELAELLKAALALLIWGGKVLVISTHDGVENAFNDLVEECRAGKKPYALVRTTFDDALRDGLYRRVCLTTGKPWSEDAERRWADGIRSFYGDAASEELDCIPRRSGGRYIPRTLLEARADAAIPILRWTCPDDFVDRSDDARITECRAWCEEQLGPLLAGLPRELRSFLGEDFGRSGDLTTLWPLQLMADLKRHTPFVVELRNVPFRQQEQVVFYVCDALPRFSGGAFDARGNGQYIAEVARQRYGPSRIAEVMLSQGWYLANMPRLKSALEDAQFDVPRDAEIIDDFRAIEVVRGIPCIGDARTKGATGQRHGDSAVAGALAYFASSSLEGGPIDGESSVASVAEEAFAGDRDLSRRDYAGWG